MPRCSVVPVDITSWFTPELFTKIFPYSCASTVFTHDNKPFWDYTSLIQSIKWMNSTKFHGFCQGKYPKLELAAFLANTCQETGDPSLTLPYPWLQTKVTRTGEEYSNGSAGGATALFEGSPSIISPHSRDTPSPYNGDINIFELPLTELERYQIGLGKNEVMSASILSLISANQSGFGLGTGNPSLDGYCAVSDDGTLYGNNCKGNDIVKSTSELKLSTTDRRYSSLGFYTQYGGRGSIQLSYNYNYCDCSLDLFNDYRLARYPNLLITTDRKNFLGKSNYFGFPGKDLNGNNQLPLEISNTTPPARLLGWISGIWFWVTLRSARKISCHECMNEPYSIGITGTNLIVNNQSGCTPGTWASDKLKFYTRICKILGIDYTGTILCPASIK
jgi:hypothetical protein